MESFILCCKQFSSSQWHIAAQCSDDIVIHIAVLLPTIFQNFFSCAVSLSLASNRNDIFIIFLSFFSSLICMHLNVYSLFYYLCRWRITPGGYWFPPCVLAKQERREIIFLQAKKTQPFSLFFKNSFSISPVMNFLNSFWYSKLLRFLSDCLHSIGFL